MGFFEWIKSKTKKGHYIYAPTMTGYTPAFSAFGDNVYASDIIIQAIRCIANEMMKLQPRHIRVVDGKQETITNSSIARAFRRPNKWMTTADLLSKMTVLRELNKNAYMYPDYIIDSTGAKQYIGLYPLKPTTAEYLTDQYTNQLYIRFTFGQGERVTLPADEVIHWRKDYGVDDYFGGSMLGGDDNQSLLKNLETYNTITQSIAEGLKCSLSITGAMKYITVTSEDTLKAERDKFVADLRAGKSTVLFLDNKAEYVNIPRDVKFVDKETLEFFYQTILRNSGVSIAILNGDYNDTQKSAFYESVLEPGIISLGQATSKVVFTDREAAFRNEIILYPDQIQNMSIEKRIAWLQVAVPAGAVTKDEIRMTVGLPPIQDGSGSQFPRGYNSLDGEPVGGQQKNQGKQTEGNGENETQGLEL